MSELLEYGKPLGRNLSAGALGAVILEALAESRSLAESRGVRLRAELGEHERRVSMIRPRLLMALSNLIQNAVQHTPASGEVLVELTRFEEEERGWVRCAVKDSGPGFLEEDLPRIFEPFFTRRRGGTGLGLSIVQRVMEEQHARIVAANRPEGGAIVTLDFPAI
jgi:signal transduction histidine kinase